MKSKIIHLALSNQGWIDRTLAGGAACDGEQGGETRRKRESQAAAGQVSQEKSSGSILDMAEKQENPALSLLHLQPAFGLLLVRHGVFCVCVFVLAFVYVLSLCI